jgi:hypothetical protein
MVLVTCTVMPHGGVLVPTNVYVDGFNLYYGCLRARRPPQMAGPRRALPPAVPGGQDQPDPVLHSDRLGSTRRPSAATAAAGVSPCISLGAYAVLMAGISFERYPSVLMARRWLRRTAGECKRQREDARSSCEQSHAARLDPDRCRVRRARLRGCQVRPQSEHDLCCCIPRDLHGPARAAAHHHGFRPAPLHSGQGETSARPTRAVPMACCHRRRQLCTSLCAARSIPGRQHCLS